MHGRTRLICPPRTPPRVLFGATTMCPPRHGPALLAKGVAAARRGARARCGRGLGLPSPKPRPSHAPSGGRPSRSWPGSPGKPSHGRKQVNNNSPLSQDISLRRRYSSKLLGGRSCRACRACPRWTRPACGGASSSAAACALGSTQTGPWQSIAPGPAAARRYSAAAPGHATAATPGRTTFIASLSAGRSNNNNHNNGTDGNPVAIHPPWTVKRRPDLLGEQCPPDRAVAVGAQRVQHCLHDLARRPACCI